MAKKATFADKTKLAAFLETIKEDGAKRTTSAISYHLLRKLQADGYLAREKAEVKKERGRHAKMFVVTAKGKQLIGAIKGAKAAAEKRAAKAAEAVAVVAVGE